MIGCDCLSSKRFGYVRVSDVSQNEARQVEAMITLGIHERDIFVEKQSGKDFLRPKYLALKEQLRDGDTLYIHSLDRFGRHKDQILSEWRDITQNIRADIVVLDMPILDTTRLKAVSGLETLITDIVLQLLSYFAEEERKKIRIRQAEGIAIAKAKGVQLGRPRVSPPGDFKIVYDNWKCGVIPTAIEAMQILDLRKSTFYKLVAAHEKSKCYQIDKGTSV